MDSIHSTFSGYIDKLYDKATYLDKYGGSVIATFLDFFILLYPKQNKTYSIRLGQSKM